MNALYTYIIRDSKAPIPLILFLCLALSIGVHRIQVDPNNRVFFADSHQRYSQLLLHEETFGANTTLFFMVSPRQEGQLPLDWRRPLVWLETELNGLASVVRVASIASLPHTYSQGDSLVLGSYFDVACQRQLCDLAKIKSVLDPSMRGRFISTGADALSVIATVDISRDDESAVSRLSSQQNKIEKEFSRLFPDFVLNVTGAIPMMNAFYQAALQDSSTLLPLAVAMVFLVLFLLVRRWWFCAIVSITGLTCVTVVMGVVGWLGVSLNTATATVPLVVFTVVVASVMHPLMRLLRALRGEPCSFDERVLEASSKNVKPSFLSSVTTILGFLSMYSISSPPVSDLGLMAASGVAISFALSTLVIPRVFFAGKRFFVTPAFSVGYQYEDRFSLISHKLRNNIGNSGIVTVLVVVLGSAYGLASFKFEEDFVEYFDSSNPFRMGTEAVAKKFAGPYHIDLEVDTGFPSGIFDPQFRPSLEAIHRRLDLNPDVVSAYSVLNVFQNLERNVGPADKESADSLAQYFMVYELSLSRGQEIGDIVNLDRSVARVSILLKDLDMSRIRSLIEEIEGWRSDFPSLKLIVTGEAVPTAYLSEETIREMLVGIFTSVLASAILLAAVVRRLKVAVVMIIASLTPTIFGFGIWGLIGGDVGMSTTLVIATTIGLIIDDTIHLLARYIEEIQGAQPNYGMAEARSLAETSPALISTSIAMAVGFLVLAASDFEMNRVFGFCSVLVTLAALAFNIVYTPALMTWAMKSRLKKSV